jgi:hypothetical protein
MFLIMAVHAVSMFLAGYYYLIHIHKKFMVAWIIYFVINYPIVSNTEYTLFRFDTVACFSCMELLFPNIVATVVGFGRNK